MIVLAALLAFGGIPAERVPDCKHPAPFDKLWCIVTCREPTTRKIRVDGENTTGVVCEEKTVKGERCDHHTPAAIGDQWGRCILVLDACSQRRACP